MAEGRHRNDDGSTSETFVKVRHNDKHVIDEKYDTYPQKTTKQKTWQCGFDISTRGVSPSTNWRQNSGARPKSMTFQKKGPIEQSTFSKEKKWASKPGRPERETERRSTLLHTHTQSQEHDNDWKRKDKFRIGPKRFEETECLELNNSNNCNRGSPSNVCTKSWKAHNCDGQINTSRTYVDMGKMRDRTRTSTYIRNDRSFDMDKEHRAGQLDTRDANDVHLSGKTNRGRTKQTSSQGNETFQKLNCNKHDQAQYDSKSKDNQKRTNKVLGFPFLKNLIGKDSGYIILELTKYASSLKDCISRTAKEDEFLELFLQVLAEGYSSKTTPSLMIELFDSLKAEHFFNTVMLYLIDLMVKINEGEIDGHRVEQVLMNMISIIMEQITRNPSSVYVFSRIHTIIGQVIERLLKYNTVDDVIVSTYEHLTEQKKKIDNVQNTSSGRKETQPPDDFRQYPIVPDPSEITGTVRPFLRSNKVEGEYYDLDEYLDVQFRLIREDFIGPLREGFTDYIKITMLKNRFNTNVKSAKRLDIKISENVRVQTPVVTEHGLCYKLQLELNTNLKRTNWEFSKRLIYGSLVCLTDNEFNSFYLATVVERDVADIKNGFFIVHFEDANVTTHELLHKVFRMAETSAYFESYRHILSSLQAINKGDLPFEKYIVRCDKRVDTPAYLKPNSTYDLRPLVDQQVVLLGEGRLKNIIPGISKCSNLQFSHKSREAQTVCILDKNNWPSKELLHLDESQYKAVQTALTNEFSIIQGPPGTGKTYIGLQIVKALLHNRSAWERSRNGIRPMLVVCFTNHALDQFLEGIVEFFKGDIVRVGGRSDSTVLKTCNLRYYRQAHQPLRSQLGKLQHTRKQARMDLMEQSANLRELATCIEVCNTEIVGENYLRPEMGRLFYSLVKGYRGSIGGNNFSYMVKWLGISNFQKMCRQLVQNADESNEEKYAQVENDTMQKQRNMIVDTGEYVTETNQKALLERIRSKVAIVFFIQEETQKSHNEEVDSETKFNRVVKATIERYISDLDIMSQEEANRIRNVWQLSTKVKWRLYRLWIQKLCVKEYDRIEAKRNEFEVVSERYREALLQEDIEIMKQASVIGMTTSGAARYQSVLRAICPRIIVIEEAAEVLEAHIVTTLSKGCEHLILIGDHKQLRPNPTVYRLAVKYNLDISLFERMIKNGMKFNCLELQHRMRPEISSIMKHIYTDLQDHEHVMAYPDVKGISTNIYFFNHDSPENMNEDIRSYSNSQEAQFAVALCRYLFLQGYQKPEITILTTYSGQLMCMRKFMPKDEFEGVKLTVVDNYQGEENTIIILSLVRSNNDDKIGFLKTENRICVALSRAKVGFYVLGNFDHLAAHSLLWKNITDEMKTKGTFGNGLKLYCQNHPQDEPIVAVKHGDFNNAPEGGCMKYCDIRLECGHRCARYCHVQDRKHETNECREPCTKSCDKGHSCPDKCFVKCKPCKTPMQKTIPSCGHVQTVPCSVETQHFSCKAHCEHILECGHGCKDACGDTHTIRCNKHIKYMWHCGHSATIKCWKVGAEKCRHPCETVLKCEHICSGTCGTCFTGRVHQPCLHKCKRLLVCGHECKDYCNNCPPCTEQCLNRCVHSVCDKRCGERCVPCQEPCSWKCLHYKCGRLCSEPCDRPRCNKACRRLLKKCKHQCIGLCGEPCPILCSKCDKEKVTEIFFGNEDKPNARFVLLEDCSHIFESRAMDKYMSMDDEDTTIQLKSCPLCKTPIRKCLRYGGIINRALEDIERVKKEIVGDDKRFQIVRSKVMKMIGSPCCGEVAMSRTLRLSRSYNQIWLGHNSDKLICQRKLKGMLTRLDKCGFYSERLLVTIENQQIIAEAFIDIRRRIMKDTEKRTQKEKNMLSFFHELLCNILSDREFMSEQEINDYKCEVQRGRVYAKYLKIVKTKSIIQDDEKVNEAEMIIKKIQSVVFLRENFTDEMEREINECIERMKELLKIDGMGITEDERLEIVNAVGLRKGHWFKCPNNHIYAIGDCGGANQKSMCPECKVDIGGLQHRLSDGNKLAPEMDGAQYAAYSEEANNMGNFDLNNLH